MMFLEEIWSRNFTNLFIAPIKLNEIIAALTFTAILRTLIGLVPAALLAIPFLVYPFLRLAPSYSFTNYSLYFWCYLRIIGYFRLVEIGPSFENIAWASLFFCTIGMHLLSN